MTELMTREESLSIPLWRRESLLHDRGLKPVAPQYCIVWEDPSDLDRPARITTPSPQWLAMALHGNVLPPVSVYPLAVTDQGQVMADHNLHDAVIETMSEEKAMEYLLQKDVPPSVWTAGANRLRYKICKRAMVPTDRSHRNAWRLAA